MCRGIGCVSLSIGGRPAKATTIGAWSLRPISCSGSGRSRVESVTSHCIANHEGEARNALSICDNFGGDPSSCQ
eukprot:9391708-Pyramimonas_sp.AAC.1